MTERTRFLVVGMQRSGTTVLHEAISSFAGVTTNFREVAPRLFYDGYGAYYNSRAELFGDGAHPMNDGARGLFDVMCDLGQVSPDERVRGLKVATGDRDGAKAMVDAILAEFRDLIILHVRRNDVLAACASFHFAEQKQMFQLYRWEDAPKPRFAIDREYLLGYMHNWHRINAELARLSALLGHHVFDYERDILTGRFLSSDVLARALRLTPARTEGITLKKSLPSPSEMLSNFAECEDLVAAAMPDIEAGLSYPALYRRHGPTLPGIFARRAREVASHPATCLRASFWNTVRWKLGAA